MTTLELNDPTTEMYIYAIGSVFVLNLLLYLAVQTCLKRDNSWIDCMWSVIHAVPNIVVWLMRGTDEITPRMVLITVPIIIWAARLSLYILIRHKSEDYRYREMRQGWEEKGTCFYYFASLVFVYLMQGLFSLIANSSALFVNLYSSGAVDKKLVWSDYVGLAIWIAGFSIEVAADAQLASHLKNPKPGSGKFLRTGVWRYSRHPNYFGESVMWWGIWVIACGEEWGWVTVYSCIFITLCIRFLSGVPFPEKKYANNPEWQEYCKETNVFVMLPARLDNSTLKEPI